MKNNYAKLLQYLTLFSALLLVSCGGSGGTPSGGTASYTIGGSVSGLVGSIVLQDNGGHNLTVSVNGTFTFATPVANGIPYSVTVLPQTTGQTCTVNSGSGHVSNANVTNVTVSCNVVQPIAAGGYNTCALLDNGGVQCWGYNGFGQLGNNSTTNSSVPVAVSGLTSGVQAIAVGFNNTCAQANGGAQCWGYNNDGQLGNNSTTNSSVPVVVTGLTSGVLVIAAGDYHTCALVNGGVQCWGDNNDGQLGNNSLTNSLVPVPVTGLTSGVQAIAAGRYHTCALLVNGGIQCWGYNNDGQLGNNSTANSLVPVQVSGL